MYMTLHFPYVIGKLYDDSEEMPSLPKTYSLPSNKEASSRVTLKTSSSVPTNQTSLANLWGSPKETSSSSSSSSKNKKSTTSPLSASDPTTPTCKKEKAYLQQLRLMYLSPAHKLLMEELCKVMKENNTLCIQNTYKLYSLNYTAVTMLVGTFNYPDIAEEEGEEETTY